MTLTFGHWDLVGSSLISSEHFWQNLTDVLKNFKQKGHSDLHIRPTSVLQVPVNICAKIWTVSHEASCFFWEWDGRPEQRRDGWQPKDKMPPSTAAAKHWGIKTTKETYGRQWHNVCCFISGSVTYCATVYCHKLMFYTTFKKKISLRTMQCSDDQLIAFFPLIQQVSKLIKQ